MTTCPKKNGYGRERGSGRECSSGGMRRDRAGSMWRTPAKGTTEIRVNAPATEGGGGCRGTSAHGAKAELRRPSTGCGPSIRELFGRRSCPFEVGPSLKHPRKLPVCERAAPCPIVPGGRPANTCEQPWRHQWRRNGWALDLGAPWNTRHTLPITNSHSVGHRQGHSVSFG